MKKIGILGGTFDPIHNGHLKIATIVQQKFNLEKIIFIPTKTPPHRPKPLASEQNRLKMLEIAITNNKSWEISNVELKRAGTSYTIDTLKELSILMPNYEWYFILGADAMDIFPTWKQPEEVLKLTNLVVVSRPGYDFSKIEKFLNTEPFAKQKNKVQFLQMDSLNISANELRRLISAEQNVSLWLPEDVISYIRDNKLYLGV